MDVLAAAYAARQPVLHSAQNSPNVVGRCARCGLPSDQLTRTTQVVSKLFTAFDNWWDPTSTGMCPSCCWGHTSPELRQHPHLVTATSLRTLRRHELRDTLLSGALPGGSAVVVPLHPGRKHLLPEARWGNVTTESGALPWTARDTIRFEAMLRLLAAGFSAKQLAEPAPAWPTFKRLDPSRWSQVMADWDGLAVWRDRPPWLDLALHAATRQRRTS